MRAHNEGVPIECTGQAAIIGPRAGRYYDYGAGPQGRLLIVEHLDDQNAKVTVATTPQNSVERTRVAHFHICTYGQHADMNRTSV